MTNAGLQFSPGEFKVKDADPEQTLEWFVAVPGVNAEGLQAE